MPRYLFSFLIVDLVEYIIMPTADHNVPFVVGQRAEATRYLYYLYSKSDDCGRLALAVGIYIVILYVLYEGPNS
jgi:hypothetical protein